MDITPFVEALRKDLQQAAEALAPEHKEAAERLTFALDPSARLAFMEAIAQAAAEITSEMGSTTVEVRLSGRDLEFVVHELTRTAAPAAPSETPDDLDTGDEGDQARITLRIPEALKTKAEAKAAKAGQSLNTWIVNAIRAQSKDISINVDLDLSSIPTRGGKRMSGWI